MATREFHKWVNGHGEGAAAYSGPVPYIRLVIYLSSLTKRESPPPPPPPSLVARRGPSSRSLLTRARARTLRDGHDERLGVKISARCVRYRAYMQSLLRVCVLLYVTISPTCARWTIGTVVSMIGKDITKLWSRELLSFLWNSVIMLVNLCKCCAVGIFIWKCLRYLKTRLVGIENNCSFSMIEHFFLSKISRDIIGWVFNFCDSFRV